MIGTGLESVGRVWRLEADSGIRIFIEVADEWGGSGREESKLDLHPSERARVAGRKNAKERLTIGLLVNADGSHAFRPLVISKSKRPHDFLPDFDPDALCNWRNNAKGWMTAPGLTTGGGGVAPLAIDLDGEIDDVGILIDRLGLGPSAMPAADFMAIDLGQLTCAKPGEDPLAHEPATTYSAASWEAPATMEAVYNDDNPASREARRTARAACEILFGYARATCITPLRVVRAL
ncbi:unnamed protein product [Closterium sp. NIES-53]